MTSSSGPTGLGRSRMQDIIKSHEGVAKQQSEEVERSKGKPIQPKTETELKPKVSGGQTSTFTPVPEEKKKTSESGGLEEMGKKQPEKLTESGSSVRKDVMARQLEKRREVKSEGSTSTSTVGGTSPPEDVGARAGRLIDEMKGASPKIREHLELLQSKGVKVELVDDKRVQDGPFYDTSKKTILLNSKLPDTTLKDDLLFESCNALQTAGFTNIEKELREMSITPQQLGHKKGELESRETTLNYVDLMLSKYNSGQRWEIGELARQVPPDLKAPGAREEQNRLNKLGEPLGLSEMGLRALGKVSRTAPGYIQQPDPGQHDKLVDAFMKAPSHNPGAPPTDPKSMPSGDLYFYSELGERRPLNGVRNLLTDRLRPPPSTSREEKSALQEGEMRTIRALLDQHLPSSLNDLPDHEKGPAIVRGYHNALQALKSRYDGTLKKEERLDGYDLMTAQAKKLEGYELTPNIKKFVGIGS
jgi:hypothetical protein